MRAKRQEFKLPDIARRLKAFDVDALGNAVWAEFSETRRSFSDGYDPAKDRVCSYSQKTHDLIQHQLFAVLAASEATKVRAALYLEAAFARIAALEVQLAEKSAGGMSYKGVWSDGSYPAGSVVTLGGSMWHANKASNAKPGEGSPDWTLCCKRGRDGRDVAP